MVSDGWPVTEGDAYDLASDVINASALVIVDAEVIAEVIAQECATEGAMDVAVKVRERLLGES